MSNLEKRVWNIEQHFIMRSKIIWSIVVIAICVTPIFICLWHGYNDMYIEHWRAIFKSIGICTFVLGSVVFIIFALDRIWSRWYA